MPKMKEVVRESAVNQCQEIGLELNEDLLEFVSHIVSSHSGKTYEETKFILFHNFIRPEQVDPVEFGFLLNEDIYYMHLNDNGEMDYLRSETLEQYLRQVQGFNALVEETPPHILHNLEMLESRGIVNPLIKQVCLTKITA